MSYDRIRRKLRAMREASATRQTVGRKLANTPIGQLALEISSIARSRTATSATAERLRRQLEQLTAGANREAVARTAVARQIEEIERYAKGESGGAWGWLGRTFGPVADTIRSLLRPTGRQQSNKEIEAAAELLNALGASTEGARGRRVRVESDDPRTKADAERTLRSLGFDVHDQPSTPPPPPVNRIRPAVAPDPTSGMSRRMLGGMSVYFRPDDPILTGEMIPVSSSNVHSIGYIWDKDTPERGTLKVRFLDKSRGTGKGGATYHYYDVHPRVFIEFQKASSKGKFVWDKLRIRGTVSGHQYRYWLASLSATRHVPRQATRIGNEEWFLQRTVQTATMGTLTSKLKDRMVRQLTPKQLGMPKSSFPNRR